MTSLGRIDTRNDVIVNRWNEEVSPSIGDRYTASRTSRITMTPPSSLTRKRPGNVGSPAAGGRELGRKPSSASLGGYAPPTLPETRRRNSPDLPVVHFRNRNIQGSGSLKRTEMGDNEGESNATNTLTQSQILGPPEVGNTGSDPLTSSPNSHCQTPSTERSSVASVVSVKHVTDPAFGSGINTSSEPQLPQSWIVSPLVKDANPDSGSSGAMLPAIDESLESGKSTSGSYDREPAMHRKLSAEELADFKQVMRVFETGGATGAQKPIIKSRSGPELCRHHLASYSQPITIQNKGYRPHLVAAPAAYGIQNNGLPDQRIHNSVTSPFQPPAKVSSPHVKNAPRISLRMDHSTPEGARAYFQCGTSGGRASLDPDVDDVSPPPLPPPPSDEALYGSRFYNPPIRILNDYNPEQEPRSAFRPVANKLGDKQIQNKCPLVVFNPSSPTLPQTNGLSSNDQLPVGKFPNSPEQSRRPEADRQRAKNLPVKLVIPNRAESFRPISQKLVAPPYQIKRRQPFRIPSRLCHSLDHIPSDVDDSHSSSSRTGSPKCGRQGASGSPKSGRQGASGPTAVIRHSLLPDNISLSSLASSEVSQSDSNLNYDSGSTAYESEYDNYRPGMASDEDYFVPEPISDVDIDMFDDVDNVQVRENYEMDMSLINKMITDV